MVPTLLVQSIDSSFVAAAYSYPLTASSTVPVHGGELFGSFWEMPLPLIEWMHWWY